MSLVKKKTVSEKTAKPAGKKASGKGSVISNAKLYDVIVKPVVTEKSSMAAEQNKITFKISPDATKNDVKKAVEAIFSVKVKKVNTIKVEGKEKRFRGQVGHRSDFRKAIVTLEAGQTIDVAAGAK